MPTQTDIDIHFYSTSTENDVHVHLHMDGNNSAANQITTSNIQSLATALAPIVQDQYSDSTCGIWDITIYTSDISSVANPS